MKKVYLLLSFILDAVSTSWITNEGFSKLKSIISYVLLSKSEVEVGRRRREGIIVRVIVIGKLVSFKKPVQFSFLEPRK